MNAAHGSAELPSGLIKKIKSLLNIKNKDNMCLAYCIAAYLLRREAAARRARELGVSAAQAAPAPSDQPPIPPELVGLAEHVTQQLRYDAEVVANPEAASYLTPPPISGLQLNHHSRRQRILKDPKSADSPMKQRQQQCTRMMA